MVHHLIPENVALLPTLTSDSDPMPPPLIFMQPVLSGPGKALNQRVKVISISEQRLTSQHFSIFLDSPVIGLAPGFSAKGELISLALCDSANALIVEFGRGRDGCKKASPKSASTNDDKASSDSGSSSDSGLSIVNRKGILEQVILCRTSESSAQALAAFDMGPLAMALYRDLGLSIKNGIDIQATFSDVTRKPYSVIENALQRAQLDRVKPSAERIDSEFRNSEYDPGDLNCRKELICRAWLAQYLIAQCVDESTMEEIKRVDTKEMPAGFLDIVAKISSDAHRLSLGENTTTKHKVGGTRIVDGVTKVDAASYKSKFRGNSMLGRTTIEGERGRYVLHSIINSTEIGSGSIDSTATRPLDLATNFISVVETVGRGDPTAAEARRAATILRVLQGEKSILEVNPWIQNIWLPSKDGLTWPEEWAATKPTPPSLPQSQSQPAQPQKEFKMPMLNRSQQIAVNSMLSLEDPHRLVIVQGPPGTGKTSVIAAYVIMASMVGVEGIWLIAQSNVAVKNIALKLLAVGFEDWKILVSNDFHNGWHEHLYTADPRFRKHLILSDKFKFIRKNELLGCKIILATLSMLSNSNVQKRLTPHIPMNILVVDEASQIEVGSYIPALTTFSTLRKICFIGDNKQLPPYGQEELKDLQSIFEIPHLEKNVIFLDTQYRMPPEIGDIISSAVYDGKLKSNPAHSIPSSTISCYFLDVSEGREAKEGNSWKNIAEKGAVLKLAQYLQDANKAYRIITPYEGQTNMIESEMKTTEGLSWEDKCFNVDAFQGNEEDYIIISLVRSRGLGFLKNLRRTNVMLTRCKRGMFIITSRNFMEGIGGDCLAGELLDVLEERLGDKVWLTEEDVEKGRIFGNV